MGTLGSYGPRSRNTFWFSHLVRCATCRKQWLENYQDLPEDKRNHQLEELVTSNHQGSNIV